MRTDTQPPLVSATSSGMSLAPDSIATTAVLSYIDYEGKKLLANQGIILLCKLHILIAFFFEKMLRFV